MEPVFRGKYPDSMIENVTDRLPKFTEEQSKLLTGSYDFLGLNYYVTQYATTAPATNVVSQLTDSKVLEQPGMLKVLAKSWKKCGLLIVLVFCFVLFFR